MDVKALYPSLDINHSCEVIRKLIISSQVKFQVNPVELAIHIAATHTQLEIDNLGISDIVHKRRFKNGPRPLIISKSVTGTQTEIDNANSWLHPTRPPTQQEEQLLLAIVISNAVKTVMTSHVYTNSDVMRLQQIGMAIGSTATAEVAKLLMLEHDQILWSNCSNAGLTKVASGRYVDDENPVLKTTPYGARLIDGKITVVPEHIQSDMNIPHDKRTFSLVQQIANNIWPNIQFTVDVPSDNPSGLIPMLDMEVGINQLGLVTRKFYSKPMNTPFTIMSRSAHSWQIKRSTLTQEGVRRLLNTSINAPNSVKSQILSEWDLKMNRSGYDQNFRANVILSAIKIYNHKLITANSGGRPVYRPSGWQEQERDIEKLAKKHTWYQGTGNERNVAPLIIDPSPSGLLEKDIANVLKEASRLTGIRIKLCQRGGTKISTSAKSDPFAARLCDRTDCPICRSPESQGGCKFASVGYQLICDSCNDQGIKATYEGETSKSGYERGLQHAQGLVKQSEDAPMWKHNQLIHDGATNLPFSMVVTGRYKKPMVRQEAEAIRIRESNSVHQLNSKLEFQQPTIIRLIPSRNLIQSDQTGASDNIMYHPNNIRKQTNQNRVDSPNVPTRSRPPYYVQKQTNSSSELQIVQTTRRQRQDLVNIQAISRSVMRNHPSTTENREYDRLNYRSPTVHKTNKQHDRKSRERSLSPMPVHRRTLKPHRRHISRKHSSSKSPANNVERQQSPSYYVRKHTTNEHVQTSSSFSSIPLSYKKHKTTKIISSVQSSQSSRDKNHINSDHMELSDLVTDCSPVSDTSLSKTQSQRTLANKPQSPRQLSLSPVSPVGFTQYCPAPKTPSVPSTVDMDDIDMFSQVSPTSIPSTTQITTNTPQPKSLNNALSHVSPVRPVQPKVPHTNHSDIPNIFKCQKQRSTIRGEKSKNPNLNTSDDVPLLQQVNSNDLISSEDMASISDEFETSWNEDIVETVSQPKTTSRFTKPPTTNPLNCPIISEASVIYAVQNPVKTITQYNLLKARRLQKVQKLFKKYNVHLVTCFEEELSKFQKSFKKPLKSKKCAPRKSKDPNQTYFDN